MSEIVKILQGDAKINLPESKTYLFKTVDNDFLKLEFEQAFEIAPKIFGDEIKNCKYQIHDRKFKDLNFSSGEEIKIFAENDFSRYKLALVKRNNSEKKFLYQCEAVPTFDDGDSEWDSFRKCVIYFDKGVNLISCRYGYKIPRIKIFLNLKKADQKFLTWLKFIDCPIEKIEVTF